MKTRAVLLLTAGAVIAFSAVSLPKWRAHVIVQQRERGTAAATRLLAESRPQEAVAVIQSLRRQAGGAASPAQQTHWRELELEAVSQQRDVPRLVSLFQQAPEVVTKDEGASLLVARALVALKRPEEAEKLRTAWRGREKQPEGWLLADADAALRRDPEEARALLQKAKLPGKADSLRLLRLAMLSRAKPADAVNYLNAAYAADPTNIDVRSARGQILERAAELPLARVEYTAAVVAAPQNPMMRDQLAEFYLRHGNYALGVQTLAEARQAGAPDFAHVKSAFWNRVTTAPAPDAAAKPAACPAGPLQPLAQLLTALPPGKFWDEPAFAKMRGAASLSAQRQEVQWLRLLDHLQNGREREAGELLAASSFRHRSFEPALESALRVLLKFRQTEAAPALADLEITAKDPHPFFAQLLAWSRGERPPGIEELARSPHALAGAFLAAGWGEAALGLAPTDRALADAPEWFRYALAQALRQNRGPAAALAFARLQPASPLLELLTGELLLGANRGPEAEARLAPLAAADSDAGFRAAWLLGTAALERQDAAAARRLVEAQPRLAASTAGRELLARSELQAGRVAAAAQIYGEIRERSIEARTWLAKEAVAEKRWDDARALTQSLANEFPDEIALRANLQIIDRLAAAQP